MTGKSIKTESYWVKDIVILINNKNINKPKMQRKKKWSVLQVKDNKNNKANEHDYIKFLFDKKNSIHPIIFGINTIVLDDGTTKTIYKNIDGNNRLNAIYHFINKPFEIFPRFLDNLFDYIDNELKYEEEIKNKIKSNFRSMSYDTIINLKLNKYYIEIGEIDFYNNYIRSIRDEIDDNYIGEIQKGLKIDGKDDFDKNVSIAVNLCEGYTEDELNQMYLDVNKYNNKMGEIDLLASQLLNVNNFVIQDNVIHSSIKDTLVQFYEYKSENEVLECYKFNNHEIINAYDFIVGFQNYSNCKCFLIEKTNDDGLPLFFKIYKTLYKGKFENTFTTNNVNNFIEKISKTIELLNGIISNMSNDKLSENLKIFDSCNKKMHTLKKNTMYLIIVAIISYLNTNENDDYIKKSIEKSLLYHFFVQDISNKDKKDYMKNYDNILFDAGGAYIDNMADKIYKNPKVICEKITKNIMNELLNVLIEENNKPNERFLLNGKNKCDKRRNRKFFEKILICYYYNQVVPTNLLKNKFSIEHIFPFSSVWDNEIDIERLGNVIPIIDYLNNKRNNKHISQYKKSDLDNFVKYIDNIIPSFDYYDKIINHDDRKPKITNCIEYNNFCNKNKNTYVNNFIKCLFD
jgi:hypothetical protein